MNPALKSVNVLSANPTGFIRSLGAFEEIYWLFSQTGPKGFAYAAAIEGRTTVDAWRKAVDQVQHSQPESLRAGYLRCVPPEHGAYAANVSQLCAKAKLIIE